MTGHRVPTLAGIGFQQIVDWLIALHRAGMDFHLDDDPAEITTFSAFEAGQLSALIGLLKSIHGENALWLAFEMAQPLAE